MLRNILAAPPAMVLCLLLQDVVVAISLRRYASFQRNVKNQDLLWVDVLLLITVMLLTLLCNFAQIAISAALFISLGANGILMFGVSTSVMTAAVMDVIKYHHSRLQQE